MGGVSRKVGGVKPEEVSPGSEWKFQKGRSLWKGEKPHKGAGVVEVKSGEWAGVLLETPPSPFVSPVTPPPETVRTATPFPMVSLFLVFTAFVISNIGHIRPQRTILAFVSGIFFILSGEPKEGTYGPGDYFRFQEPVVPLPLRKPFPCCVILEELQNLSEPHFVSL